MIAQNPYLLGIDIGSSTLKIVCTRTGRSPVLSFYSVTRLPENYSEAAIVESIQKTLKENKSCARDAVLTFTDESLIIRRLMLPHVARDEIIDALKWQAKDLVHYDVDKAVIDFELLGETEKEDGSKVMDLLVVIASRDEIDKKVKVLKEAGLNAVSITVSPFALKNLLKMDQDIELSKNIVIIDIGYKKTELSIFKNKAIEFVRYIAVGSGNITEAMTGSLTLGNGSMALSRDEAEKLKLRLGISYEDEVVDRGITSRQILSLMRSSLERLAKEIKRSMDYYTQEYGTAPIDSVYLIGGGALLKNMDRFLSEELNVQVKLIGLPRAIDVSKVRLTATDLSPLIPLISAVLGYKKCPNLLPSEYRQEKIEFIEKISLRMTAIIVGIVLLASFLFIKFKVGDYTSRLRNAVIQKNILDQIKYLQDRVVERSAFLSQARMSEIPLEYIMKELSRIIPQNCVLDNLSVDQKTKTLEMKGVIYEARGTAEEVLTKFMEALERSRYFKDAQLTSVQGRTTGREASSNFEMSCLLE